jgi:TolB protein
MNQKQNRLLGFLAFFIFALSLFGALAVSPVNARMVLSEGQITSNIASQEYPDVYGYNIVWQDNRNGNWDIYLYNVMGQFPPDTRLTTNSDNQMNPAISGSNIVYEDYRNGNSDIYFYNLTSQTETRITTSTATQKNPDIDGNYVVWQDNRNGNWDIYFYDLSTRSERRLTMSASNEDPKVSGNFVVFGRWVTIDNILRQAVFAYELSTGNERQISSTGYSNDNPAIFNSRVVYESARTFELKGQNEVVMYDLVSGATWETSHPSDQENPAVDEYYIVYEDYRYSVYDFKTNIVTYYSDIYLYNLNTEVETQITNNTKNQVNPAVQGGRIVYQDDRNGNWDIYMTMVGYVPDGNPPLAGAGPPNTAEPSATTAPDNQAIIPTELQIPLTVAIIAIIIVLIALTVYYRNHRKKLLPNENQNQGN